MDEVPAQRPAPQFYVNNSQYTRPVPTRHKYNPALLRQTRRRSANKAKANNVPPALLAQAAELRSAKSNLERAYAHERNVQSLSSRCTGVIFNFPEVFAARARAERRYVNCLIRYLRDTNQMSAIEARQLQGNFTKHKIEKVGANSCVYVLDMYPFELN
jgi:hypothetical protein